ncbi:MAG TPA: hypothetical protein VGM56_17595 [Byssovorax sp.]|jgi:hypothetical protein
MKHLSIALGLLAAGSFGLLGCDGHHHDGDDNDFPIDTTSFVVGHVEPDAFPQFVSAITVTDETGLQTKIVVGSNGSFAAELTPGHTYRFSLAPDGVSVPLVLRPTADGLRTDLEVTAGGASIDLGAIHYADPAAYAGGEITLEPSKHCGGGVDANGLVCTEGDATQVCSAPPPSDQCEASRYGVSPCDTSQPVKSRPSFADATQPLAAVELIAPASIGCGIGDVIWD